TNGCYGCHQMGNKATRTVPKELGHFDSSAGAWSRRIVSGQAMAQMLNGIRRLGPERGFKQFGEWTDRVAAGELPAARPTRPPANPDFCKRGSEHPSARVFPVEQSSRHLSMYDPKTRKITLIRTCFSTHHLVFAEDDNHTLWTSAGGPQSGVLGWLNRKMFDQ